MGKKRKRRYDRILYPHIRHIAGLAGFNAPAQCEVDVDDKYFIVKQGSKERVLYYENIMDIMCGSDNTLSDTFFDRETGMHDIKFNIFPNANRIAIRGATFVESVRIWYQEDKDKIPYDIVFIDDIDNSKRKECLVMGIKIEYQYLQRKHKDKIEEFRKKHNF